jgi:cysteate synthase
LVHAHDYGKRLGLKNLVVAFSGYLPERGATNATCSFKELEAAATIPFCLANNVTSLVIASAGNTAKAFALACSEQSFKVILVVPETALKHLWLPKKCAPCVTLLAVKGSSSYYDAICISEKIAERCGIPMEGGVRNIARRDGLGTIILEYAAQQKALPDHYVQAVGSGVGAIATYEASRRLIADGRFGQRLPMLHLVQDRALAPIHDAWSRHLADVPSYDENALTERYAEVLANSHPA